MHVVLSFINRNKLLSCFASGLLVSMLFSRDNLSTGLFLACIFPISIFNYSIFHSKGKCYSFFCGWSFGVGYFSSMTWIANALLVYEEFRLLFPFAFIAIPLFLGSFFGLFSLFCLYAKKFKIIARFYSLFSCVFWILFEYIRMFLFTGLPWNLLAHSISFSEELMQLSSVGGELIISFIVCFAGNSFFYLFARNIRKFKVDLYTSILMVLLIWIFGYVRLASNSTEFTDKKIRIIQPCLEQFEKWDGSYLKKTIDKNIDLSIQQDEVDFIVWPEAAIPTSYDYIKEYLGSYEALFDKKVLLTGGISYKDNDIYSSFYAVDYSQEMLFDYHKSHLVPFGEYIPFKSILPIKKLTHGLQDYSFGETEKVYEVNGVKIKPLICYEIIFSLEDLIGNSNADVIINPTNDSWYGVSNGPYQHFNITRFRAVENGLPIIRSANNGISAVIDPLGRVIDKLELNYCGYLDSYVPKKLNTETVFSKYKLFSVFAFVFVFSVLRIFIEVYIETHANKKLLR